MGADALAKMAEQNMAMFQAAAGAFMPGATPQAAAEKPAAKTDEIDALKSQMAEMQRKLDELGK